MYRTLKNKTKEETEIKFYKTMPISVLLKGCEMWVPTRKTVTKFKVQKLISNKNQKLHKVKLLM